MAADPEEGVWEATTGAHLQFDGERIGGFAPPVLSTGGAGAARAKAGRNVDVDGTPAENVLSVEGIAVDRTGVFLAGHFQGLVVLVPEAPEVKGGSDSASQAFLVKHDRRGKILWAVSWGAHEDDPDAEVTVRRLGVDGRGQVVIVGAFVGCVDFDPGKGVRRVCAQQAATRRPCDDRCAKLYVSRFTSDGKWLGSTPLPGIAADGVAAAVDPATGRVALFGSFVGAMD